MNISKLLIGTLLGGVVYFLLGWLVYGILLKDTLAMPSEFANVMIPDEEFKIGLMALSCLVWGLLITFIFQKWANIATFLGGLKGGAIIGLLTTISFGLGMASMYKFGNLQNVLIDAVATGVNTGLAGGAIGWWLGRGK